jgi:exodeoxyribonuclease VII small subunit
MTKKGSDADKNSLSKLSFEEAIRALSQIVQKIESGQVPLQESLEQYEKGMRLIAHCRTILQEAEKRITKIEEVQEGPKTNAGPVPKESEESAWQLDEEDQEEKEGLDEDEDSDWLKG